MISGKETNFLGRLEKQFSKQNVQTTFKSLSCKIPYLSKIQIFVAFSEFFDIWPFLCNFCIFRNLLIFRHLHIFLSRKFFNFFFGIFRHLKTFLSIYKFFFRLPEFSIFCRKKNPIIAPENIYIYSIFWVTYRAIQNFGIFYLFFSSSSKIKIV